MKIKQEFVTNSSSESFVVMGTFLDESDLSKRLEELSSKRSVELADDFETNIDILIDGSDLHYSYGGDWGGGSVAIGLYYTDMKDDETLGQFKERVQKQLEEYFGIEGKPGHIEMAWEDR